MSRSLPTAFRALENRQGVVRRPGSAGDAERGGDEEELPAAGPSTGGEDLLEPQVVEQPDAHRVQRENVDRELDALGLARSGVAVSVGAEHGDVSLGEEGHGPRVKAGLVVRRVPGA